MAQFLIMIEYKKERGRKRTENRGCHIMTLVNSSEREDTTTLQMPDECDFLTSPLLGEPSSPFLSLSRVKQGQASPVTARDHLAECV